MPESLRSGEVLQTMPLRGIVDPRVKATGTTTSTAVTTNTDRHKAATVEGTGAIDMAVEEAEVTAAQIGMVEAEDTRARETPAVPRSMGLEGMEDWEELSATTPPPPTITEMLSLAELNNATNNDSHNHKVDLLPMEATPMASLVLTAIARVKGMVLTRTDN